MVVAFIGHRNTEITQNLRESLVKIVEELISVECADTFVFGSKSAFDDLCYETVTGLKEIYPHIKRIYARANYENIEGSYSKYLLSLYDQTFISDKAVKAGALAYVMRNQAMIDMSEVLVVYYSESYKPNARNSGTCAAVTYARKKHKRIINLCGNY